MLHVQSGFVIIYPRGKLSETTIARKNSIFSCILQHQSLNCACANNANGTKEMICYHYKKNHTVNSKCYYCKQKYMDLACTRT